MTEVLGGPTEGVGELQGGQRPFGLVGRPGPRLVAPAGHDPFDEVLQVLVHPLMLPAWAIGISTMC